MKIRHISFDFWGTLAHANTVYGKRRAKLLEENNINPTIYTEVKSNLDKLTAKGEFFSTDDCYSILLEEGWKQPARFSEVLTMKAAFIQMFIECPPIVPSPIHLELLRLKDEGYTLSIGSNTNFIPGAAIKDALPYTMGLFDHHIFSDELLSSKPHPYFFHEIIEVAKGLNRHLLPQEVLHVGDSGIFDMTARDYGIQVTQTTGPDMTASVLQRMLPSPI